MYDGTVNATVNPTVYATVYTTVSAAAAVNLQGCININVPSSQMIDRLWSKGINIKINYCYLIKLYYTLLLLYTFIYVQINFVNILLLKSKF